MECCQLLKDGVSSALPFERVLAVGYYDGPTEGFSECAMCRRCYYFKKLAWDESQDIRIFAFTPLNLDLAEIVRKSNIQPSWEFPIFLVPN